ncbi:MAG: Flp pilus assembly complex ATPase component TadA [Burkholderiaceae bacterium]|nr:Flp pilus assembly complex ATPase component TadA [Burkholderiaceae bacterium]
MSDLSTPLAWSAPEREPLPESSRSGVGRNAEAVAADRPHKAQAAVFSWPTPPFASYPQSLEQQPSEDCLIVGLNDKEMRGRLSFFVPDERVAHVQVPPARTTMALRFKQFKLLTVLPPIEAGAQCADGAAQASVLTHRPRSRYRVALADGSEMTGETIGHVERDFGLFLFPPADAGDSVRRLFIPREAYSTFEAGERIGAVLVQDDSATPRQIEQALEHQQALRARRIGEILVARQALTPEQLLEAIDKQASMPLVRIGDALLSLGFITQAQLDGALAQQASDRGVPLGEVLVRMGAVSPHDLQLALARKMGFPIVAVAQFPVEAEALRKLPFAMALRLRLVPLMLRDGRLVVALADLQRRREALEEIEFLTQLKCVPVLAQGTALEDALRAAYEKFGIATNVGFGPADAAAPFEFDLADTDKLVETLEKERGDRPSAEDDQQIEQSDNSLVRLINNMIIEAWRDGVSDIHIESHPGRERIKIRFRKDGLLHTHLELPHNYRNAVIARIKIMCDLDISERRKPQDGKINFAKFSAQHRIELRVATIPTNNGLEDVVMRLLASAKPMPLDGLGLSGANLDRLKLAMERPYGMILCVGPTGSGKTTTLHSALSFINVPERKIWTAEDPIEITQPGLRQVQVNPRIDWTFAKALRAFLRADPDVIMVGEVRDTETAQVAIEASLTGHLVLSTLHTNSAPETVTRLLDMGMDPFNFADSLLAVLAQRLVRRLCPHCRTARAASEPEIDALLDDWLQVCAKDDPAFARDAVRADWLERFGRDGRLMAHHSAGCEQCDHSGHKGRAGIHELMIVSRELRQMIQSGERAEALQQRALADGMRTLRQDGIEKVLQGLVSIEEVRATSNA